MDSVVWDEACTALSHCFVSAGPPICKPRRTSVNWFCKTESWESKRRKLSNGSSRNAPTRAKHGSDMRSTRDQEIGSAALVLVHITLFTAGSLTAAKNW